MRHGVLRIQHEMKNEVTHLASIRVNQTALGRQLRNIKCDVLAQEAAQFLPHPDNKPIEVEDSQFDFRRLADGKNSVSRLRLAPSLRDVCMISKLVSHYANSRQVVRDWLPMSCQKLATNCSGLKRVLTWEAARRTSKICYKMAIQDRM